MDPAAESYYIQAKNAYQNKEYDQSLDYIKKAIIIDNKDFDCWCLITEIYLSLNKTVEASSCAITLLDINSNNPYAWHLRARTLIGLMRYDEALLASNKSLELDGQNEEYKQLNKNIKSFIGFRENNKTKSTSTSQEETETSTDTEIPPQPPEEIFNPTKKYESIYKVTSTKNIALFKQKKLNSGIYYKLLDNVMDDAINIY